MEDKNAQHGMRLLQGAIRCREVFHLCIDEMDYNTNIFCFWLFSQTESAITMMCPLFKELVKFRLDHETESQTDFTAMIESIQRLHLECH